MDIKKPLYKFYVRFFFPTITFEEAMKFSVRQRILLLQRKRQISTNVQSSKNRVVRYNEGKEKHRFADEKCSSSSETIQPRDVPRMPLRRNFRFQQFQTSSSDCFRSASWIVQGNCHLQFIIRELYWKYFSGSLLVCKKLLNSIINMKSFSRLLCMYIMTMCT